MTTYLLSSIIFTPFCGAVVIYLLPKTNIKLVKIMALLTSLITYCCTLLLWLFFDNNTSTFQFVETYQWINSSNIIFSWGVDGISLFFVLLTALLVPICILSIWSLTDTKTTINGSREFFSAFLIIESFIIAVFLSLDLFIFYVFFESVLIPMFFIIGIWGSRERKIRAAYIFFIYTLFGSLFILAGLILIYVEVGTLDYLTLLNYTFSDVRQKFLWLAFFSSFAVKVPIFPMHVWLPEAHVEAPTAGSVILAGILLKLGTYGIIRFLLPLFPAATVFFSPLVYTIAVIAIIYTSLTAIRQTDIKRVIAYASVAHMNITLVGLFSLDLVGIEGSILQILSHGLVSGALFICVGVLYDRHHTRLISYYGGVTQTMPLYALIFLFFTIANIALPGTSSFVGEFIILIGIFNKNTFVATLAATGIVLGGAYSLWLFNRIAYGNIKMQFCSISFDVTRKELIAFTPLIFLTLLIGIYPNVFLEPIHMSSINLILQINLQLL